MKKDTIIQIVIIAILVIILDILVKFAIEAINENSVPQMISQKIVQPNENMQGQMGNNSSSITYSGNEEITSDEIIESGEYSSEKADENAILVSGDINATLSNITVNKTGDSDEGDNTSFYGINSGIIEKSGANLTLKNITVTTNATGANGVFSYGGSATTNNTSSDETTVISDSNITTIKDNSGGIMTTGGGILKASNLTVNTAGISSAAIRTDRGGGTVIVDGGTYTTTGAGSPSVYSTADITVNNATLTSKTAEGIVIEGKNSVTINNCDLTDSNTKLNGLSTTYKNIFSYYQSMSGDADTGTAEFTANNSTITTNNGDSFYVTNTTAIINLSNNIIVNNDVNSNFLRAKADSCGNTGANGGDVTLVLNNQNAIGNIVIDSVSKLDMRMESNSYYEGTINEDNTANNISLKLDNTSSIKLTGDSYINSLECEDETYSNIDFNGYKLYVNGVAIN